MEDTTKALGAVTSSELGSTVTNAIGTGTSAANSFLPIPAFESQDGEEGLTRLPGRIVTGAPPVGSKVYKSAHDCSASQHFEGETSGWGRVSPEYRDYSLLGVRLEPSGVATLNIEDGSGGGNQAKGFELRGSMQYRVDKEAVSFYVDTLELAPALKWTLLRGPGGQRVGRNNSLEPDPRSPAELFRDVWNGVRESSWCGGEGVKLKDQSWPEAPLVEWSADVPV